MHRAAVAVVLAGTVLIGCEMFEFDGRARHAGAPSARRTPTSKPLAVSRPTSEIATTGPAASSVGEPATRPVAASPEPPPASSKQRVVLRDHTIDRRSRVEAWIRVPAGYVITGIGLRADLDRISTLRVRMNALREDGSLGRPTEQRDGWSPDREPAANIDLPDGYVAVGFGAAVDAKWNVTSLVVWARPLSRDGKLGEQQQFRAGTQPDTEPQAQFICPERRVLTSVGFGCRDGKIRYLWAESDELAVE